MMARKQKIFTILILLIGLILLFEIVFRHSAFLNSLGTLLYRRQNFATAEQIFSRNGDEAPAAANKAKSHYKQGEFAEADSAAQDALQVLEDSADVHYDRGNIAYMQDDYRAAVESYEKALLIDPDDEDVRANLELALKKLEENPPPKPQPKSEEQEREKEEVQNALEALDNLEARERKEQSPKTSPKIDNWW